MARDGNKKTEDNYIEDHTARIKEE